MTFILIGWIYASLVVTCTVDFRKTEGSNCSVGTLLLFALCVPPVVLLLTPGMIFTILLRYGTDRKHHHG